MGVGNAVVGMQGRQGRQASGLRGRRSAGPYLAERRVGHQGGARLAARLHHAVLLGRAVDEAVLYLYHARDGTSRRTGWRRGRAGSGQAQRGGAQQRAQGREADEAPQPARRPGRPCQAASSTTPTRTPTARTWLLLRQVPRPSRKRAALRTRSALKLEAPTARARPCSCTCRPGGAGVESVRGAAGITALCLAQVSPPHGRPWPQECLASQAMRLSAAGERRHSNASAAAACPRTARACARPSRKASLEKALRKKPGHCWSNRRVDRRE